MRWLLASRYIRRHRDIVAAEGVELRHAPDVVDVVCPGCGQTYIADLEPHEDPPELEWPAWLAEQRLAKDCPDHIQRMAVG
jgi:hypothetical protein